ncbi:MAG: diguanylate cyclase [Pyrinomonadaceae bacterium]
MQLNLPKNEQARLDALHSYQILDTLPEQAYDDITQLAAQICQTPIALVTFVDKNRQWFKSKTGFEVEETGRDVSFCSYAILEPDKIFTITNAESDERFADNPLVRSAPHIRFYAGAPLVVSSGEAVGSLCVIDREPRTLSQEQQNALSVLARQVVSQLELRRQLLDRDVEIARHRQIETILRNSEQRTYSFLSHIPNVAFMKDAEGRYVFLNQKMERLFNLRSDQIVGKTDFDWLPRDTAQMATENDRAVLEKNEKVEVIETFATPNGESTQWLLLKFPFTDSMGKRFVGGVSINVNERLEIELLLLNSEERMRLLFENSPSFVSTHDLEGKILSINPAAAEALHYHPDELIGTNFGEILDPSAHHLFADYLKRVGQYKMDEGVFTVLTKTGEKRIWKYHNVVHKPLGDTSYVIGHAQDVTELQQIQERLRDLSIIDELTGLYNLRGFQVLAEQTLKFAIRSHENCVLLYADLDNLKQVNDSLGDDTGSQMIVETANLLKKVFRDSDIIARVGGNEFTVLLIGSSPLKEDQIKKRLQKHITTFNAKRLHPFELLLSVGLLRFEPDKSSLEDAMQQANHKMYQDKKIRKTNHQILIQANIAS